MSQSLQLIQVVQAVERAKQRIPEPLRDQGWTFFSDWDLWEYHVVLDGRTCPICEARRHLDVLLGSKIRLLYPYLEIIDMYTIMVNEHPNCRCFLRRTGFEALVNQGRIEELLHLV